MAQRIYAFNRIGVVEAAATLAIGGLLGFVLGAAGLGSTTMIVAVLAIDGIALLVVDYWFLRRRRDPLNPMMRLVTPRAGGHLYCLPGWALGAGCLLFSWVLVMHWLQDRGGLDLPAPLVLVGFLGFLIPIGYEYLVPFDLPRKRSESQGADAPIDGS